jgi:radical SAM protein with 4Fe4S-binding SPASM domain
MTTMKDSLYLISWNVTRRCNLSCAHCYLPAGTREDADSSLLHELNTEEALQLIDQIAVVNPEVMLILSGGEPLLRGDIFELAAYASGKGMMVVLGSNGLLIDNEVALHLRKSGVSGVSVSLDSVSPKIHDDIRSCDGAWKKAVEAIEICRSNGLPVQINTVVTRRNCDEIPGLMRNSAALGAKVFSPFFLVCTGRGEELTDITPLQYEEILSFIVESGGKYDDTMIRTRCAPTFRRILYQNDADSPLLRMDTGRCLAGLHYCRITPEGDVTPCPYLPLSLGNVKEKNFKDLWSSAKVLDSLRTPSLKGKCGICEFRLICGGCRARAYTFYHDYMAEDPWCEYAPKEGEIIKPPAVESSLKTDSCGTSIPRWTKEAEERLKRVPLFVRSMVRSAAERYAVENCYGEITPEMMDELRQKAGRMGIVGH